MFIVHQAQQKSSFHCNFFCRENKTKGCVFSKSYFSEAAFKAMDRNKDGYITKGELKLAKKKMSMKEVDKTIKDYDLDNDGKLNYEEFLKSQ